MGCRSREVPGRDAGGGEQLSGQGKGFVALLERHPLANGIIVAYHCTAEENESALSTLRSRSWLALRRKLEEQTSDATVLSTLRTTFEDHFRYDEQGVPRVWKPQDDIEGAFKKAKDEVGDLP